MSRSRAMRPTAQSMAFGPHPMMRTDCPRCWSSRASSAAVTNPSRPTEPSSVVRCRSSPSAFISDSSTRSALPRPPYSISLWLTRPACDAQAPCMNMGGSPTPPATSRSTCSGDGAGKLVPSGPSTETVSPAPARSSKAVPRPTVLASTSAVPPVGSTDSSEKARGSSGSRSQSPRSITNWPGRASLSDWQPSSSITKYPPPSERFSRISASK